MPPEIISLVNMVVVPIGLGAIMFSMGLSLSLTDFREVARNPKAVAGGLFGQLVCLPPLALLLAWAFRLPPEMAMGLFILAVCPGGITSNAITYAAKANVALAVVLTTLSSLITVFTIPFLVSWALGHYFVHGEAPQMSPERTMLQLAQMTLLPVLAGMALRRLSSGFADRVTVWLRPASLVVLVAVILFSVFVSLELVIDNLLRAGPAAFALNVLSMGVGLAIATILGLSRQDRLTVGIEVGIHNATMATFLSMSILQELALAVTPTIYGVLMVINAGLLVRWFKARAARQALEPAPAE
ncbi:bile acid:sodium symporter family protein [Caulobacter sp. 17J80-11]|uniref:bile acid:sodium symporter family protein n=1 Tax=Caulobacter sp. 17J80-11 TaxID=2763502 RepID=UPI001653978E|nr:bile acid:sodium symporter family protein [Caulobacter sp. 17J80-11]MBC6983756.1 bile acid:sodium symporter family protein [Caulobacter sp. 17J80-11]